MLKSLTSELLRARDTFGIAKASFVRPRLLVIPGGKSIANDNLTLIQRNTRALAKSLVASRILSTPGLQDRRQFAFDKTPRTLSGNIALTTPDVRSGLSPYGPNRPLEIEYPDLYKEFRQLQEKQRKRDLRHFQLLDPANRTGRFRFVDPLRTLLCAKRRMRRSVLFALGRAVASHHPRRNQFSNVRC